jgi:hypothetical protein
MSEEGSASIYDKMDWKKIIQIHLDECLKAMGTLEYPKKVKALVSCFATHYPNFDAKKQIDDKIKFLDKKYELIKQIWDADHQTDFWWEKQIKYASLKMEHDEEVFEAVRDLCGEKRMLLWGGGDSEGMTYGEL